MVDGSIPLPSSKYNITITTRTEQCTTCKNKVTFKWALGPIPIGHPVLSDHGYILCDKCLRTNRCPVCKMIKDPAIVFAPKTVFIDTDTYWGLYEAPYVFLIPIKEDNGESLTPS